MTTFSRFGSDDRGRHVRASTGVMIGLLGASAIFACRFTAGAADASEPTEMARWTARTPQHPFDDELRLLAADVIDPAYEQLLAKMLHTDLEAEWQRVGTVDNYQTFVEKHGGKEKVLADPQLKEAYEVRREIAVRFIALIRAAYEKQKRQPPFSQQQVDDLCAAANRTGKRSSSAAAVPLRALMPAAGAEAEWPQFRGPTAQGIVVDQSFPFRWSADTNIRWRKQLPGRGNSSPIVWGQKLFVTAASADGKERLLLCYSTETGELLWQHAAPAPIEPLEKLYNKNTYASSTPVTDGERVIAFFGNSGLLCCDLEGHELWQATLGSFPTMHGPGTSPVLYQDKVIFLQDQNQGGSLFVAFDKHNGREAWRQTRPAASCWSTPLVVRAGQRDELLCNGSHTFAAFDPDSGAELWRLSGPSRESIPMPVVGGGKIYSVSGRNGPMLAVQPGGNGDVLKTHVLWSIPRGGPHVPTPAYVAGRLFMVNDMGIASCRDAETGELVWQERLSGRFSMSILSAQDKLLVTSEEGTTHILKAADKFEELGVNELNETILATPAIVRGRIYFRSSDHLICIAAAPQ